VGIPLGGSNRNSSSQSTAPTKSSLNKGYGGRSCERDRRGGREILGLKSGLRTDDGRPFVTDNWKVIIDLRIGGRAVDPLDPWRGRHRLFLKMADTVLVADGSAVRELSR
jgi:hypothetical protein